MYNQLPMQVSLMERERERMTWMKELETLRALGDDPVPWARSSRWIAAASGRLARLARNQRSQPAGGVLGWRPALGSRGAA